MSRFGIDYAWGGPPSVAALRRAGVTFVGRYLSYDPGKNINAAEYRRLHAAGIDVVLVWETTADRARAGAGAGRSDAENAEAQRKRCGIPPQAVHLAVDFDAEGPEVEDYFRGAQQVLGDRLGAYAGYRAVKHLFDHGLIAHGWQTYAWSGSLWDARAKVRQYSNGHVFAGVDCDLDVAIEDKPAPLVPADEARWEREYDQLLHRRGPWAAMRRRVLRRVMTARRKEIWRLAQPKGPAGWDERNRRARYEQLLARTE